MQELGRRFPDPVTVIVSLNEDNEIKEAASQSFAGQLDAIVQKNCTGISKFILPNT
jgi:hypothetical protein